ncbi:MAG: hypothetical protein QMC32_01295 [Cytophagales bacterium]|jgi:hypothetical protein
MNFESYLDFIYIDFLKSSSKLKKVSYVVKSLGFSNYPIFIVSKKKINLNSLLFDKKNNDFYYYVSNLDFFIKNNLIFKNKVDFFKKSYKDPYKFCCLFILNDFFNNFLYVSYSSYKK